MEPLDKSTVLRAGQRPAMVAYVPITVFIAECIIGLALFRLLGFWAIALFPVHLWFVIKTADDVHWVATLWAGINHTFFNLSGFIRNKGLHGQGVITFTASPLKAGKSDYANFQ